MSGGLLIREGGTADLGEAMVTMVEGFPATFGEAWTLPQLEGAFSLPGVTLLLARMDDQPAGFALIRTVLDEAELLLLAVRPGQRRRGIARSLLTAVFGAAVTLKATHLHLEVRDGNPARILYESAGLGEVGRRRAYYRGNDGSVHDAITLSRRLDS
ncbi:GNAT family N-acetyltransferase [Sphingomonas naphthae]|uniref:GNAT family N-acetyltransferase n=1 Tax=Sphingomonas naphthae TaxID=1813468 RepID=A0ABY7TGK6_9SPHN|nr:GNAT family N-acetyltransferase [Sphingomonas naphthae]WCT72274.1 GNAT family N-acetyltransferase [Sphingomonas naphthae]